MRKDLTLLVVGSGGREHAIIKKLRSQGHTGVIYCLPGNGGMEGNAVCAGVKATDIDGIVKFAVEKKVGFAIVAPDDPLALGAVDRLTQAGIPSFGPEKKAAVIESSKIFAKDLMKKYGIPTAAYEVFDSAPDALAYLETAKIPTVVKADGLALGKGVTVAFTRGEAQSAVRALMEDKVFGESGSKIVIEEYLEGPEVSVLSFTDGKVIKPMVSSMDHKRAYDGNRGPNTGGMGTIAPNPHYTPEVAERCRKEIFEPTVAAMNAEGRTFKGCLYFGLMITKDGPKVIEYNCRFGDPETQVVLPLLESDLGDILEACSNGTLADVPVEFSSGAACCVVKASKGYPLSYEKGFPITKGDMPDGADVIFAGAKNTGCGLVTDGGRVLGVVATGDKLSEAREKAYAACSAVGFENEFYRKDIGSY